MGTKVPCHSTEGGGGGEWGADTTQGGGYPLLGALGNLCLVLQDEQGLEFVRLVICFSKALRSMQCGH